MNQRTGIVKRLLLLVCITSMPLYADNFINQPTDAIIKSTADARGVQNVDTSLTQPDSVEVTESKVCVIDSKLDSLEISGACDPTPITASETPIPATVITGPVTLDTSGHYCLAADLELSTGESIAITGTNVTLDLNGYTVFGDGYANNGIIVSGDCAEIFNGTISGFANAGISITGNKNNIHDVDAKDNSIGFELVGADNNVIEHSRALCNTSAGFSLSSSTNNCVIDSSAVETKGLSDTYGFISTGGRSNRFINTVAKDTAITQPDEYNTLIAAGFCLGSGESCSEISNSTVNKVRLEGDPFYCSSAMLTTVTSTAPSPANIRDRWLVCDDKKYIATGGSADGSGNDVRVYRFDEDAQTLTLVASFAQGADGGVRAIDWLSSDGRNFLAVGGEDVGPGGYSTDVRVLEFDCTYETLTEVALFNFETYDVEFGVQALEWQVCNNEKYIALAVEPLFTGVPGGVELKPVQILKFDSTIGSETLVKVADFGIVNQSYTEYLEVDSVRWLECYNQFFISVRGEETLQVLEFDCQDESLSLVTDEVVVYGYGPTNPSGDSFAINDSRWLMCNDKKFLAYSTTDDSYLFISIAEFDDDLGELNEVVSLSVNSSALGFAWTQFNNTCTYLAVAYLNGEVDIYLFDCNNPGLVLLDSINVSTIAADVNFQTCGIKLFLASIGGAGDTLIVNEVETNITSVTLDAFGIKVASDAFNNIVCNNLVHGVNISDLFSDDNGIGFSLNLDNNLLVSNKACDNDINYVLTGAGFTQADIVKSQADARGVQNVDCSLTDLDTVEEIESKVCIIQSVVENITVDFTDTLTSIEAVESKLCAVEDTINEDFAGTFSSLQEIESKVCDIDTSVIVLDSKVDALGPCDPTPIIETGTPADPPTIITGGVTITESGHYCLGADIVITDILGFTPGITVSGSNIRIDLNGYTIFGLGYDNIGIRIEGGSDCVEVFNGNIKDCQGTAAILIGGDNAFIHDVTMVNNAIGVRSLGATGAIIQSCYAIGNGEFGFDLSDSTKACVIDCKAYNNQDGFVIRGVSNELSFIRCIANSNTMNGFLFIAPALTLIEMKDCQALYNSISGFDFAGMDETLTLLRNVACQNGPYGDDNYINLPSGLNAVITSPANANGWDNIDCSSALSTCEPTPINQSGTPVPPTPITGPVTLDTSGHYCLSADVEVTGNVDAITITGDDVTLDLNGYTVSLLGGNDSPRSGIVISGENVEVFNGTIKGFNLLGGIEITGDKAFIHNVTVKNNASGFFCSSDNETVIQSCHATCNTTAGFTLSSSTGATIVDCKSYANTGSANGFEMIGVFRCSLIRCIGNSNGNDGFAFTTGPSVVSEVKDCQAFYNGQHGFNMDRASSSVSFYRNIACENPPSVNP